MRSIKNKTVTKPALDALRAPALMLCHHGKKLNGFGASSASVSEKRLFSSSSEHADAGDVGKSYNGLNQVLIR